MCECLKSAEIWVLPLNYCCYSRRCWGWLSSDWLGRVVCTLGWICYRLRLTCLSQCPSLLCYILLTLPPPELAQAAAQTPFQCWGHTATLSSHSLDYCGLIMVTGDAAFMSHGKDGEVHRFALVLKYAYAFQGLVMSSNWLTHWRRITPQMHVCLVFKTLRSSNQNVSKIPKAFQQTHINSPVI